MEFFGLLNCSGEPKKVKFVEKIIICQKIVDIVAQASSLPIISI
jgi:hypothetical protein